MEEEKKNLLEIFTAYMEQDIRGVEILTYGVASVGLAIALRRIRPFARFAKPMDIPAHFVKSKIPLHGRVTRIEPSGGPLVLVDHKPLIPLPRFGKRKELPVKVAGVDVTGNGISWLQTVVSGKEIVFVPLKKNDESLECTVTLIQGDKKETLQIGQELVKLGFGMVHKLEPTLLEDKQVLAYQKSLVAAQKLAERKRNGHWHFAIYPTLFWKMQNALSEKSKSVLPAFVTRQLNI